MSEKYPGSKRFLSGEKEFIIPKEDFEIQVARFVSDPINTLIDLHLEFVSKHEENEDFDIIEETFLMIDEYVAFIKNYNITVSDLNLMAYVKEGQGSENGDQGLFRILKKAGYPKEDVKQWINRYSMFGQNEDKFLTIRSLARLDRVYADN